LAKDSLRETNETHPRVLIWGTLEARVQGADLYILAGLNEGTWPETGDSDPWLNRQMRKGTGLRVPERKIGLSAHDYQQLICQKNVWITRSIRSNDAETVPSRWINRLMNLLNGLPEQNGPVALDNMRKRGAFWLALTDKIDNANCEGSIRSALRPAPCPPIEARPKTLAVTDVRTLIRDPYAIYAKHILRLRRLNPLNATPDARMRGTVVHEVLENYFREWPNIPADWRREKFMEILEDTLHNSVPWPSTQVFWRNRLDQVIDWLIDGEAERRKNAEPIGFEASGRLVIPELNFTIRAIADRVDQRSDGSFVIYDYKTGVAPTEKQQLYFDKQLYLLALVAEHSGFAKIEPNKVFNAAFVGLGNPAKIVNAPFEKESVEEAYRKLRQLIERYQDPDQGFTARRALFKSDDFSDYDHLSRYGEWDVSHPPKKERLQ
jgi:RecB family exonuclease